MLLALTIGTYIKKGFTYEEATKMIADAGFEALDYSFFSPANYGEATDSADFQGRLREIRSIVEGNGLIFNQAHAPFPSNTADPLETEQIFKDIVRSMRNASTLGVKTIVVHPMKISPTGEARNFEQLFELNMDFYHRLRPYCEEYNIRVAIENMWEWKQHCSGKTMVRSVCGTSEELVRYIDELNSEYFVACLDIGHALLVGREPEEFIRTLGAKRLQALHVHDVSGFYDTHTIPFHGGLGDWDKITQALKEIQYGGDFTYEAGNFLNPLPKELIWPATKYMAEVGKYLVNKIV